MQAPQPASASVQQAGIDRRMRTRLLAHSAMFPALPGEALDALAAAMTEQALAPGTTIFRQDDAGTTLFAVLAGQVRIVTVADDGRERVLRQVGPGEMFGEIAALDGRGRSADAIAATRCRLLLLERRRLLTLIAQHPGLATSLLAVLCERLRATSAQVEGLWFQSLSQRLAATLLELRRRRLGSAIDITQSELAQLTGVTRESVNKKLRAWQAAELVTLRPGRIVVPDERRLRRLVETHCYDPQSVPLRA